MKRAVVLLAISLAFITPVVAEELSFENAFLLRNISGTAANPGPEPHHARIVRSNAWTTFLDAQAFVAFSSETGPEEQRTEVFSTNWFSAGAQRTIGSRGLLLVRGRVSLEPISMQDDAGYPQMLQLVSPVEPTDAPLVDRMRPQSLLGEAAAHFAFRTSTATFLHLYGAFVGDPALGTPSSALRSSSREFAVAPFAYDVQESFHEATRVATLGWSSRWFTIEGSAFHDARRFGDYSGVEDGDIDSHSARLTVTPTRNWSLQISQGTLGEDLREREISTASISYANANVAASVLWTEQEDLQALGLEIVARAKRNTVSARMENVDRPAGVFGYTQVESTTHFQIGYIFDVFAGGTWRGGIGANIDYHSQTHDLPEVYGHKPQAIYAFVRFRTE
ncbi:MAG TPA: hypothetical protein VN181_02530 [Thermoanaerobaculia bacterium]|nr:hypothetical protein [Thermoanaerobaculia bacterium]